MNARIDGDPGLRTTDPHVPKEAIRSGIIAILEDMTEDWGIDGELNIGPNTRLVADLEFVSVDIIHLVVAIEEHYQRSRMGFQELLMKDGRYVDDLTVEQLVDFVALKALGKSS